MSVVFHDGSLVRVIPSSDKTSLSMLCSPLSRAERVFLEQDPNVHGWVLDSDHQLLHIFLFCFLREVFISSEHVVLVTSIPMALAMNDLVLALRCGSLR